MFKENLSAWLTIYNENIIEDVDIGVVIKSSKDILMKSREIITIKTNTFLCSSSCNYQFDYNNLLLLTGVSEMVRNNLIVTPTTITNLKESFEFECSIYNANDNEYLIKENSPICQLIVVDNERKYKPDKHEWVNKRWLEKNKAVNIKLQKNELLGEIDVDSILKRKIEDIKIILEIHKDNKECKEYYDNLLKQFTETLNTNNKIS